MSEEKKGFFARLKEGLNKTRNNIVHGIDSVFSGFSAIDDEFYEELEEILIMGDIGVNATSNILDRLKQQVKEQHIKEPSACKQLLIDSIKEQMQVGETAYDFEKKQSVILVIGVNGVGKTTSVGKLAGMLKEEGRKVLIAAADTFRAAAGEQLAGWANRAGVDMIGGAEGSDPASVVFDAVNAAKARHVDVLLCDTAGRLHNKKEPDGRAEENEPDHRPGISGCPSGKPGGPGWNHRAECPCTGQGIRRGSRPDRYYPYKDGRYGERRDCGGNPVGAECAGEIYRRGRGYGRPAEIRSGAVRQCSV